MKNIGHNKPPENFTDQEEKTDLEKLINDVLRLSKSLLTYLIFLFTLEFFVFVLTYAILVSY